MLSFNRISFADLAGWEQDDHAAALAAFQNSCIAWAKRKPERRLGHSALGVNAGDFREVCAAAGKTPARKFFESNFVPFVVVDNSNTQGLFTGYYEPLLRGARAQSAAYPVPLYRKPANLISADLGEFSSKLKGRRILGRVSGNKFRPYHSHAEINAGALKDRGLELIWVDSAVDAFFLQIQGSGRVRLEDGSEVRISYAGKNGRPYRAIGRDLIASGAIAREKMSMQAIRQWLEANPGETRQIIEKNASFVFFRELKGEAVLGALGVPLTPGRSLAVDRRLLPLGAPIWLQTTRPGDQAGAAEQPFDRLMLAQDTGGAIRGGIRGDVFWGHGTAAEWRAGHMKSQGSWALLLPREVAARWDGKRTISR